MHVCTGSSATMKMLVWHLQICMAAEAAEKFAFAIFCIYKDVWTTSVSFTLQFLVFAEFVLSWFGIYWLIDISEPIPGRLDRVSYFFCMMS